MIQAEIVAKSNKQAEVRLHGTIAQWSTVSSSYARYIIETLEKEGYDEAVIKVHSAGGSVYEGIAMKNIFASSKLKITFINEGIAASMMTQVMLAANKILAYRDARFMVHQASSGIIGSSKKLREEADNLDSINDQMAENYAKKTGKEKAWILKNWMPDNKDTWFTAQEALDAKLIDGIIDEDKATKGKTADLGIGMGMVAFYDDFFAKPIIQAQNEPKQEPFGSQNSPNSQNQNQDKMKEKIIGVLAVLGCTIEANADENTIVSQLENGIKVIIKQKQDAEAKLVEFQVKDLEAMLRARGATNEQINAVITAQKAGNTQAVELLKSFLPETEQKSLAVQVAEAAAEAAAKNPQNPSNPTADDRKDWNGEKWVKEDPKGLLELEQKDPKRFEALMQDYEKSAGIKV